MHFLEPNADADETLSMTRIGVRTLVQRAHIILLRDVVDQQLANEPHHPWLWCLGAVGLNSGRHSL